MMKRSWLHRFLPLIGFAVIISIVFGQALLPPADKLLFGDDLHLTYYFFRKYFQESLHSGVFPFWNPYLFSGTPFAAHPQTLLPFYPLNWLFVVIPLNVAFSWYLAIHILIAMIGMYWFCRMFTGKISAWTSGLTFGLSGFFMARVWAGHVDMIAAGAYLPLVFGFFWRAMHKGTPRSIVLASLALALQIFVGYQTIALFTLEAVVIATIFACIQTHSWRPFARTALAVTVGLGLAAIQLVPQQEFVSRSIRSYPFPYEWASAQALTFESLKTFLSPFIFGDQRSYFGPWPNLAEYAAYIGLVPLGLALTVLVTSMFQKKHRFLVMLFTSIALFALWISFARNAPIDLLKIFWEYVPVYKSLRIPARHLLLFVFAGSMLSGLALHTLKKPFSIIITAFIIIDLVPFARHFIELRDIPERRHDTKLIALLLRDSSLYRILPNFGVWLEPRSSLDFDSAMTHRLFSTTGYDPSILRNYYEFIDAASGHTSSSFMEHNVQVPYLDTSSPYINFLNIKYIFIPNWLDPLGGVSSERYKLLLDNPERGYRLYENHDVLPRFFLVSKVKSLQRPSDIARTIVAKDVDLSTTSLVTGLSIAASFDCPRSPFGNVSVESYRPNRIQLSIQSPCDSFLTSSEVYYPGWMAEIDGKRTDILEGNLAFRNLFIPKGNHEVTFWYSPRIFFLGGIVSIVFVLFSIILFHIKKFSL